MVVISFSDIIYSICSLVLTGTLMSLYFRKRSVPTRQNRIYLAICICVFVAAMAHLALIMSIVTGSGIVAVQTAYVYAVDILEFTFSLLFAAYTFALTGRNFLKGRMARMISIPIGLKLLFVIFGFATGQIFEYNPGVPMLEAYPFLRHSFAPTLCCMVLIAVVVIKDRAKLTRFRKIYFLIAVVWSFVALGYYVRTQKGGLLLFSIDMIVLLLLYLYQNPAVMRDRPTGLWNSVSFRNLVMEWLADEKHFEAVYLHVENYSTSFLMSRPEIVGRLYDTNRGFFGPHDKKMMLFRISMNTFVCLREPGESDRPFEKFVEDFRSFIAENVSPEADAVRFHRFTIRCPEDASAFSGLESLAASLKKRMRGSDQYEFVLTEQELEKEKRRRRISEIVKQSLQNGGFEVYYQPIYNVSTGTFTSAEALLRLHDPENEGRFISPGEFIPVAEQSSDIIEIGRFVLDSVCGILAGTELVSFGIQYIEVNLSVVECIQNGISDNITSKIKAHRVSPDAISYEITETASEIISSVGETNIRALHENGMKLALDDFGTGYSSIFRLSSLPFNLIKIDKSVVDAAVESEKGMKLLRNLLGMVNGMDKESVVEGVETEEMADRVMEAGAAHIQGYYYARPMDRTSFLRFIREKNAFV